MIVDCHTHVWESPEQLGRLELGQALTERNPRGTPGPRWQAVPAADPEHHLSNNHLVDKTIVLGFKSRYMGADIPNQFIADYVRRAPQKLIGFAGIDPTDDSAADELRRAFDELNLQGITVSPANQDFHPSDTRGMEIYAEAERLGMPILFHPGGHFTRDSKLEYSRPHLLDEVARSFPNLRIIIAAMGHPWIDETICMLGKHDYVFADVSGLLARPWMAYSAMVKAHEYGVMDRLLFGSDFPYTTASDCIEALYSINQMTQGTNLPGVPREALRGIVERNALDLLRLQ